MQQANNTQESVKPGSEFFNRPPRILVALPQGTANLPAPPEKEALPPPAGMMTILMPLVMIAVIGSMYLAIYRSFQQVIFLLPMMLFSLMYPVTNLVMSRQKLKSVKKSRALVDQKYQQKLDNARQSLTEKAALQHAIALSIDPNPEDLEGYVTSRSRLWERRPEDHDFLSVRVGKGNRPFSMTVQAPEVDIADPWADTLQAMLACYSTVNDMPCDIPLKSVKSLGITGKRQDVAALLRGMLCQIAVLHSPEDVRILGIYPTSQKDDWQWMAKLPHTMPIKGGKQERLVAEGEAEANELLNVLLEELSQRVSQPEDGSLPVSTSGSGDQASPLPHIVVLVHDYVDVRKHAALTNAFKLGEQLGVSVIYMVAQHESIPSECRGVLSLSDDGLVSYATAGYDGEAFDKVHADKLGLDMSRNIAAGLSPIHVAQAGGEVADLPTNVRFLDLVGLEYADQFDPETWWGNGAAPRFGRLRVPIGMGMDGPIWLDLNESAHGPHGIIAGTTGAGKSELLQSLIIGLAMTHHPHLVNFVLVDFKGGAAFKPFEKMPHTVGMITDLSGRLAERALTALKSELRRREHILSNANARKIVEYQALRAINPAMEPLPNLLIIIDEFAELAKEHPTFMEGLVSVVQKGRSLGVHLILATQKPTGSVNPNIWSNLKFRICLRVASLQDSRDMLGRSEAALLPSTTPGRAYFQIGSEIFELFQSARVSLPARVFDESVITALQEEVGAGEVTDQTVLVHAVEPFTHTLGATLFKPWPAPLPHRVTLAQTMKQIGAPTGKDGEPSYGWLNVPIGLIDLPAEQKQEPLMLNMLHSGGHVMIAGASGVGKSTFLRTLVMSLMQTHTPSQVQFYMIDFGGQALRVFEKLPHVGGVFSDSDSEYIRRLLQKLSSIIDERKQHCIDEQIDDFEAYQRRRAEHGNLPEMPAIVLIIDKFNEFKQAHDKDLDTFLAIAREGRNYGVCIVAAIDRPVALSSQILSLFEYRIALRLVELTDSLIFIGKLDAAHLDQTLPGRGYKRGKLLAEIHIALPTSDEDDNEQTRQIDEMVTAIATATAEVGGVFAPRIRLLPEYVSLEQFLQPGQGDHLQGDREGRPYPPSSRVGARVYPPQLAPALAALPVLQIPLGIEDISLQPIALELNAETPHFLVSGGPGSGRTSTLQMSLMMLATLPENAHARVILVDFRRNSRALRRLPNIWMYADNEERLVEAMERLKAELRERKQRFYEALESQQDSFDELVVLPDAPIVLIIDDYEQFSVLTKNPLHDLKEFLLQARDLRLHVIVAGSPADLSRSDALLLLVRVCRMGIVLGADPQEQPLLGVRMSDMPPGRGYIVRRNKRHLMQVAFVEAKSIAPWLTQVKLAQPHLEVFNAPPNGGPLEREPAPVPACLEHEKLFEEAKRIVDATGER